MNEKIKVLSTDFDGTLFAEFENPPVPENLQRLIAVLQAGGTKWVINTGRDMSSLMEALGRAALSIEPDYLVLVEREIFRHCESLYVPHEEWNEACDQAHQTVFDQVMADLPEVVSWINSRFHASIYEDPFSPFCLIARNNGDMDQIVAFLEDYCKKVPDLVVVRNDVYARFSHRAFNKGTALAEICRLNGYRAEQVLAIGDHLNDLPMLQRIYAGCLAAPANAVPQVRRAMAEQGGYLCKLPQGRGVAEAINHYLAGRGQPQVQGE